MIVTRTVEDVGDGRAVTRAATAVGERRGLLVTLTTSDGFAGVGEASPLAGYSTETLDSLRDELSRGTPKSGLARFALESAELDLAGRSSGRSAAMVLGGGRSLATVATSAVVTGDAPHRDTLAAIARGATTVKLKVGGHALEDARMLVSLRATVGPHIELRADANGAYSPDDARRFLDEVGPARLSFVEEPVAAEALLSLRESNVPIGIDESLCLPGFDAWALDSSVISVFVLKPARLGLHRARELALAAHTAGKGVVVTHMFDGPWALAASAALALSLPFTPLACGLAPHAGLRAYPQRRVVTVTDQWMLVASQEPGLGVMLP